MKKPNKTGGFEGDWFGGVFAHTYHFSLCVSTLEFTFILDASWSIQTCRLCEWEVTMTPDEAQQCMAVLQKLLDQKHQLNNQYFLGPVQPLLSPQEFETYLATIAPSVPMDLIAVRDKLQATHPSLSLLSSGIGAGAGSGASSGGSRFRSPSEFASDVRMTFTNAIAYNKDAKVKTDNIPNLILALSRERLRRGIER